MRSRRGLALVVVGLVAALVGFAGAWLHSTGSVTGAANAAMSNVQASVASFMSLDPSDMIVAGHSDGNEGLWVLARDSGKSAMHAYHFDGVATHRFDLPLSDAGRMGGIAVGRDGTVWAGSGQRVVAFEPSTGAIRKSFDLPVVTKAVARAQRTPDGIVLGLGQVSAITDGTSGIWISRYAAPEITFVDNAFLVKRLPLPADVDPSQLISMSGQVWFTTNFGTDERLGSLIGKIDEPTQVSIVATPAASLSVGPDGLHAFAQVWRQIDSTSGQTTATRSLPSLPIDVAAVAIDHAGRLIARGARQTQLHVFDRNGVETRSIDYAAGSFVSRGRTYATSAPLAFLFVTPAGTIWFGAQSGSVVYRAA